MLGALIHPRDFSWAAFGKHPVAMDYIRLAAGTGLMEAVGEWMSKGYDQFIRRTPIVLEPHSFRFWIRGARKGTLLCGLGRDSSDRASTSPSTKLRYRSLSVISATSSPQTSQR